MLREHKACLGTFTYDVRTEGRRLAEKQMMVISCAERKGRGSKIPNILWASFANAPYPINALSLRRIMS